MRRCQPKGKREGTKIGFHTRREAGISGAVRKREVAAAGRSREIESFGGKERLRKRSRKKEAEPDRSPRRRTRPARRGATSTPMKKKDRR